MTAPPITATALVWPQALSMPLPRFVVLAVLLHVWLVLMLGNAPGGTAQVGQGVYGRLNITLQGAPVGPAGLPTPPPLPATPTGAPGPAEAQRFGGALRSALPQEALPPGAAQLGDWAPVKGERPTGEPATAAPEPAALARPEPEPPAPPPPPPPQPVATAPTTFGATPMLGLQRTLVPIAPSDSALPRVAQAPVASLPAVPAPQPGAVAAPLKQLSAAPLVQAPPEAALRATPTSALANSLALTAVPLPSAALAAAGAEKQLLSRLPSERSSTGTALAEVGRANAAPLLGAVPAAEGRALAAAVPVPSPAPTSTPALGAAPPSPAVAAAVSTAGPTAAPPTPPTPDTALPQLPRVAPGTLASAAQPALPTATPAAAAAAALQSPPRPGPALPQSAATASPGAPDAGSRVGNDVATLPSTPASAPKRLNLELPRLRGGELSRYSTTGVLPALPRPPEVPDKLGAAIEKTAKEDCRKAYAAAGLLAVVPLVADAVRDGGCKW